MIHGPVVVIGAGFGWWVDNAVLGRLPAAAAAREPGAALLELERV
jgi:hypothetical protein